METFAKLFSSILDSTIWDCDSETRVVWITLLAMADQDGRVHAAVPGIANRARVSVEAVEKALDTFQTPDPYSRTPDHEGRRIKQDGRDWVILNYKSRRNDSGTEAQIEKERERKRLWWRENRSSKEQSTNEIQDSKLQNCGNTSGLDASLADTSAPSSPPYSPSSSPVLDIYTEAHTEEGGPGEGEKGSGSASGGRKPNLPVDGFSLSHPDSKTNQKPTEPPDNFTPRQVDFFRALQEVEFFVRGRGIITAWEAVADPVRLARNIGQADAYPLVDTGLIDRLGAWSLENRAKAKKDIGKFIVNRVAASQERGLPRGAPGSQQTPESSRPEMAMDAINRIRR